MLKKEIISLQILVIWVCPTMLNISPHLISKPRIQKTRITAKLAMAQRNPLKICRPARSHHTTYIIVNIEVITDAILLGVVNNNTKLPQITFHFMV